MTQLDDYRWLVSPDAEPWLRQCREQAADAKLILRLRRELGAERAALVIRQAELRRRARAKFSRAGDMFFTNKALMQASGEDVARYKASRTATGSKLADLCCGIGGDLMALAARGLETSGVEQDECVAVLARANAELVSDGKTFVEAGDAQDFDVGRCDAWHIDPDRRTAGRRTTRLEQYEPDLDALTRLLEGNHNASVKLAPATETPERWRREAERQWIGADGECKQQVAWFGALARHPGRRTAVIIGRDGSPLSAIVEDRDLSPPRVVEQIGRFVFEPHAAVLAAELSTALAHKYGLAPLSAAGVYLTGDASPDDSALSAFEVRDVLPFDVKKLRGYLREAGIGRLEIKKRGVEIDPGKVRQQLQGPGDEHATLLITRIGSLVRAIVGARRTR
jgi:hypothetical protein